MLYPLTVLVGESSASARSVEGSPSSASASSATKPIQGAPGQSPAAKGPSQGTRAPAGAAYPPSTTGSVGDAAANAKTGKSAPCRPDQPCCKLDVHVVKHHVCYMYHEQSHAQYHVTYGNGAHRAEKCQHE